MPARPNSVPYDPVNSVAPETRAIPGDRLDVRATPEEMGAGIGQAEEGAGRTLEQVGDEANSLAVHLGEIYNDSKARDAVVAASTQLGQLENQYRQNKGNNAADALSGFQQQVQKLTEDTANSMPTTGAQKMFRDQFTREAAYSVKGAGSYAADQLEQAQIGSLTASIGNKVNQFAMSAADPSRRSFLISTIKDDALQYAHAKGMSPEEADNIVSHNVGEGYAAAIKGAVTTDPDLAKKLYDEASSGTFKVNRDGKDVDVPFLDAAHRASIDGQMNGEFRRQEGEALQTARMYAATGDNYNREDLISSMKRVGRSDDYINAELHHLDSVQNNFGSADMRYSLEKSLQDDQNRALAGLPVKGNYDAASVAKAYPHEPTRQQDVLNEVNDLHVVAGFVGGFTTRTPDQIMQQLNQFKPAPTETSSKFTRDFQKFKAIQGNGQPSPLGDYGPAIDWTMQHEGGFVSNDSGKGATNFGINQEANPDLNVSNLTKEQAAAVMKTRYFDAIGADKMSPDMALVAGDTAVNMGVGKAKQLIEQADGNPNKLIQLRLQEYNRLATENPEKYGQYLDSWNNRMSDLQKEIGQNSDMTGRFTEQERLYQKMETAAQGYFKNLNDDPAGTVMTHDPLLTQKLNDGLKDPSKLGDFINASLARQTAVGVPDQVRAGLPSMVATSMANNIMQDPQSAPQKLNDLRNKTGDYWPEVYKSMVTHGALPTYMQSVAVLGSDPTTLRDANLLAQWKGEETKGKADDDLLGAQNIKDINKYVQSDPDVNSLMLSLQRSGASASQVDDTMHSIQSLAYAKLYYDRDNAAAANAVSAFTSKYEFLPNGGARIPKASFDAVTRNAQIALNQIDKLAVAPLSYTSGIPGQPNPDEYYAWVKNSPTWVTSPDASSVILKDPQNRVVLGKNGKPISIKFSQASPPPGQGEQMSDIDMWAASQ